MNQPIRQLTPTAVWSHFADLNAIPRASKKEERVIDFMKKFGESLGLPTQVDEVGNVIISKPATPGMEDRQHIILQSHLDMVHQKNNDTTFDFDTQGIDMYIDGDWVRARGTTLGADNGLGVAAIMALLSATDIPHPAFQALFTIDEETGMTGAKGLKGGLLHGTILLNLDTEEDDELTIGCAGGVDVTATGTYTQQPAAGGTAYRITLSGLTGGHSGAEIHLGRANANKLLTRLLLQLTTRYNIGIAEINGGGLRNAIPREATALILADATHATAIRSTIDEYTHIYQAEYRTTDPRLTLTIAPADTPAQLLQADTQLHLLSAIYACPNGIYRMSPDIPGLVQSSNNIARVQVQDGQYTIQCLTRSSVDTEKDDLAQAITAAFTLAGATVSYAGSYPGWQPQPQSAIVQLMSRLYEEMFGQPAHVNAIHAGLECGIIGTNYPQLQMISFGPTIRGAHSPDECANIPSLQKFWKFLLQTLKQIPVK